MPAVHRRTPAEAPRWLHSLLAAGLSGHHDVGPKAQAAAVSGARTNSESDCVLALRDQLVVGNGHIATPAAARPPAVMAAELAGRALTGEPLYTPGRAAADALSCDVGA